MNDKLKNKLTLKNTDAAMVLRDNGGDMLEMELLLPADFTSESNVDPASPPYLIFLFSLLLSNKPQYNEILATLNETFEADCIKANRGELVIEITPEKHTVQ